MSFIETANEIFWGWLIAALLLGAGIYYGIRLGLPQIRHFKRMFQLVFKGNDSKEEGISAYEALCVAVGGQVGSGNIVGVATAIASGGYGAVFWMWITALLGMPLMLGEAVLAQMFRVKREDGTYGGGAPYYLEKGAKQKWLAAIFAIGMIIGPGLIDLTAHTNSIATSAVTALSINPLIIGIGISLITAIVVFGGIRRVADVASHVVPIMAIVYIIVAFYVLITNMSLVPKAIILIIKSAFSKTAIAGGALGFTVKQAFRYGVARGLFSNEAGMGNVGIVHATANVKHPAQQGILSMFGVFFDTIIICSATAVIIILTGAIESGKTGAPLTQMAMELAVGNFAPLFIFLALLFFSWTSMIYCVTTAEINVEWFFPGNKIAVNVYRVLACLMPIIGSIVATPTAWELLDFTNALMTFANVIGLLLLIGLVDEALNNYEEQIKEGIDVPTWDWDTELE